jgi:transcriptional regulator with XRE-family HTH domain
MSQAVKTQTVGGRIRECREKMGLTVTDLSYECRISEQNIRLWERGDRRPSRLEYWTKLSDVFGVSVDFLMTGK